MNHTPKKPDPEKVEPIAEKKLDAVQGGNSDINFVTDIVNQISDDIYQKAKKGGLKNVTIKTVR